MKRLFLLASLLVISNPAFPEADVAMDVVADIEEPDTSIIGGEPFLAKLRLQIYRTPLPERKGIIVYVTGFGANDPDPGLPDIPSNGLTEGGNYKEGKEPNFLLARDELGFDIYYTDWYDGIDYMQRNAMPLVALLEKIKEGGLEGELYGDENVDPFEETPLGPDEKLVVIGGSMGGVVSRFALAYMETNGIDHGVDLWMTVDSPHAGAYIPISAQYLVDFVESIPFGSSFGFDVSEQSKEINSPAARQLLLVHHIAADDPSSPLHAIQHSLFYNELRDAYGDYPQDPMMRRVAVSNGRGDGKNTIYRENADDTLLDIDDGKSLVEGGKSFRVVKSTYDAEYKIGNRVVWEKTFDYELRLGINFTLRSTQPGNFDPPVFEAQFVRKLLVDGEEVTISSRKIREHLFNVLDVPDFVANSFIGDIVSFLIAKAYDYELPVASSIKVDADFAYDFLPGGLSTRTTDAAKAVGSAPLVPRHCFIPATSSVGLIGEYNTPLESITAADTPFDAIYYEPNEDGNRNHVRYTRRTGLKAFEQEVSRILDAPTIFSTIPEFIPEGANDTLIVLKGAHFTENTVALWNGSPRTTTFVSEEEIRFEATKADLDNDGLVKLTLQDPISEFTGIVSVTFEVLPVTMNVRPLIWGPGDLITFRYDGLWRDGNTPRDPQVTIDDEIEVLATTPNNIVPFVFTPYRIETDIGRLPAGTYPINYRVTTGLGTELVDTEILTLDIAAPTISSVSPSVLDTHGVAYVFEIIGSGFFMGDGVPANEATEVLWNGVPVPAIALNRELLRVEVPPEFSPVSNNVLEIINPEPGGGVAQIEIPFTGPVVDSSVLSHVTINGEPAQRVTVTGANFGVGALIYWNGEVLTTEDNGEGVLTAIIPSESADSLGAASLTVVDSQGRDSPVFLTEKIPPANVILVKAGTPDGDDGQSWDTAFDSLNSALDAAAAGDEIWVAAGVYAPPYFGPNTGFELVDGVALFGGFAGNEKIRDQRNPDPETNGAVLSADRLEDDANLGGKGDNTLSVATGADLSESTLLDGFTLRAANGTASGSQGGGIKLIDSDMLLRNLIIESNTSISGGGLYIEGGSPQISDTIIRSNSSNEGGGVMVSGGSPQFDRVIVIGNRSAEGGGLYFASGADPTITNSIIAGNDSPFGGGIRSVGSSASLSHVTLSGNIAGVSGGAISNLGIGLFLENCILWGNTAPEGASIGGVPIALASAGNTIEGGHPVGSDTSEADPLFVAIPHPGFDGKWYPDSGDNNYGNLRLLSSSPASGKGAYEGVFDSFENTYNSLDADADANNDGITNILSYLMGLDPDGEFPQDRVQLGADGAYLEFAIRTNDGTFHAVNELSKNLVDWYTLSEGEGSDIEIVETETLPNGLARIRGRVLLDSFTADDLFSRARAQPRNMRDGLRSNPEP